MAATTDGGATWSLQQVPVGSGPLLSIACPSTSTCFASGSAVYGGEVLATTDGGATWATQNLPSSIQDLTSISCPSPDDCWAGGATPIGIGVVGPLGPSSGGDTIVATTDGGSLWSVQGVPSDVLGVASVSCSSTTDCWASGMTESDYAILSEVGVTVTPNRRHCRHRSLSPTATPRPTSCTAGSPVGTSSSTTSPRRPHYRPNPSAGEQFHVVNYQTQLMIPSSIASAAQALGNTEITGDGFSGGGCRRGNALIDRHGQAQL